MSIVSRKPDTRKPATRKLGTRKPGICAVVAALALPASASVHAQQQEPSGDQDYTTVYGAPPSDLSQMSEGPKVRGLILARSDNRLQVQSDDGTGTEILISDATEIRSSKGLFGLYRSKLAADALLNGLPVTVKTVQWGDNLVARHIKFRNTDLKTASMIRSGTAQKFGEQGEAIGKNAIATEALRGRLGDIDKYNVKQTTNVYFDTGKASLSPQDKAELCATANEAQTTDNALMLVVGYTDSTGSQEINQRLSEKRASGVVNYLQQACGWKPYRMLTPTGMAEADPLASNDTAQGKAQNRRVSVNILVSKSVDGI